MLRFGYFLIKQKQLGQFHDHITDIKRNNRWLTIGELKTKILKHFGFKLGGEDLEKYYIGKETNTIGKVRIINTKRMLTHNPRKEKMRVLKLASSSRKATNF